MKQLEMRSAAYQNLCKFVLFFMAAAASFNGFYQQSYFKESGTVFSFPPVSFDTVLDGTAYRPYIYRQLLPLMANWVDSHVPQSIKDKLYNASGASGRPLRLRFINSQMAQDPRYFLRYAVVYALVFIFSLIAVYALFHVGVAAGFSSIASAFGAVIMIIAFPYFGPWGLLYYDFPELAFFAIVFWMALKLDWWYMVPVVILATLNKESFLLFIPSLYPIVRLRSTRVSALAGSMGLGLMSATIYYLIKRRFEHNPGAAIEYHLNEWLKPEYVFGKLTEIYGVPGQNLSPIAIVVIVWTVFRGWGLLSKPVRQHAQIAAAINLPLFLLFCTPGELRDLSMLYVVFFLLILCNLTTWIQGQFQPNSSRQSA